MKKKSFLLLGLFYAIPMAFLAQNMPLQLVTDQTFSVSGSNEYAYALAEGDHVDLHFEMLVGRKMKSVEWVQYPDNPVFKKYDADSVFDKSIEITQTGIYLLRFAETGLGKKVCRFTLHRSPKNAETSRFDTRVQWDLRVSPQFVVQKRVLPAGKKTEVVSLGGEATVPAAKLGLKKPLGSYQFELPPNTVRWAYRIAVGQAIAEARKKDAEKLSQAVKSAAVKLIGFEPETALAAYAVGITLDLSTNTPGEDVAYALADEPNALLFKEGKDYQAYLDQPGVTSDTQRRTVPLSGKLFFLLKNDNWVDDIRVSIEIEAVVETQLWQTEQYVEAVK